MKAEIIGALWTVLAVIIAIWVWEKLVPASFKGQI